MLNRHAWCFTLKIAALCAKACDKKTSKTRQLIKRMNALEDCGQSAFRLPLAESLPILERLAISRMLFM